MTMQTDDCGSTLEGAEIAKVILAAGGALRCDEIILANDVNEGCAPTSTRRRNASSNFTPGMDRSRSILAGGTPKNKYSSGPSERA